MGGMARSTGKYTRELPRIGTTEGGYLRESVGERDG